MYQASLDDLTTDGPPLFAAASYVCGDQTHARRIQCGRKVIGIPQNVHDVLRRLRFGSRPRLVWIDYLCIKQRDAREKSHQVRLLHKIYAQAHVVSWLGTGSGMDLSLMVFYLSLSAQLWTETIRANHGQQKIYELAIGPANHLENYVDSQATVRPHKRALRALSSIASSTYFRRVWILQKFILGKTNTCQIGDTLHSVASFAAAAQVLPRFFSSEPSFRDPHINNDDDDLSSALYWYFRPALQNQWGLAARNVEPHDLRVVIQASERSCSDPRDYIYGVASLFQDPDAYVVGYTLSDAEVFAGFTAHCLSSDRDISVLNMERLAMYAGNAPIKLRSDLPTWCPDWSVRGGGSTIRFKRHYRARPKWKASGMTELVYSRPSRTSLALRGFTISTLTSCSGSTLSWRRAGGGDRSYWVWLKHSTSLCDFLKLQGLHVDHDSKDMILGIFARVLQTDDLSINSWISRSRELRLLLDGADQSYLVSLLAPLYLAKADPKLFEMAGFTIDERIPPEHHTNIIQHIGNNLANCSEGTRLFFTDGGMMGTGYPGVRQGDLVCIIHGSSTPQIHRRTDEEGHFTLVGACNVDGLMYGEGLEMGFPEQEFVSV